MDHLRTELENRLCIPHPQLKAQYLLSNKIVHLTTVMWEDIKTEYVPFVDVYAINAEHDIWHHKIANRGLVANKLCKAMDASY